MLYTPQTPVPVPKPKHTVKVPQPPTGMVYVPPNPDLVNKINELQDLFVVTNNLNDPLILLTC